MVLHKIQIQNYNLRNKLLIIFPSENWDFIQQFINSRPLLVKMEISGENSQAIFALYETGLIYLREYSNQYGIQFQAELKMKERIF